ncbi:unnamed protein product [Paramecium octaurelia]|uniref:Uncharacterized protein n=1 Tax=Paramecium octaurelia TaxID=43137 RepID=A0A8S1WQH2_PAROT|nr:unnamed protein product [Paramecium octaurelia]
MNQVVSIKVEQQLKPQIYLFQFSNEQLVVQALIQLIDQQLSHISIRNIQFNSQLQEPFIFKIIHLLHLKIRREL